MTTVTIDIDSRAARLLLTRAPQRIDRALRAAMEDSTVLLLREQQTYPPAPAGSTYKRTNTLRRSWSRRIRQEGSELVGEVGSSGNTAPYNRYVQDQTQQASIHRGRWSNTAQETARRNTTTVQRYFDRRLREEFSR